MTPEQILAAKPLVLDQRERERYFEDGFLVVPGYVGAAWLDRLRAVVAAKVEESRALSASDDQFDLAPDHSAEKPNIRRLRKAVDQHPELWAFAQDPAVVDLVADLLGPGRALPQLEAQLQVVRGRRRRALAPGHPGLAAHELARAHLRRLPRRHRPRAGPPHCASRHAPRADLRAVRRRRQLDGRRRRARRGDAAHRPRPPSSAGPRARWC